MDKLLPNASVLHRLMAEFKPSQTAVLCAKSALPEWRQLSAQSVGDDADPRISCHTSTDTLLPAAPDLVYVCEPDWATAGQAVQGLGYLRDHVQGVVVVYQPITPQLPVGAPGRHPDPTPSLVSLSRTDFFALGYQECAIAGVSRESSPDTHPVDEVMAEEATGVHYLYSLRHYKTPPAWLNAKYWANPERWDLDDDMAIGP